MKWAGRAASEGPSRFVGREGELRELNSALDAALDGRGRVQLVVGEAGSGKTALVGEFVRRAQDRAPDVIAATGQSDAQTGIGDPYLPFREVLALLTGDVDEKLSMGVIDEENAGRLRRFLGISGGALVDLGPDLIGTFIPGVGLATRAATYIARKTGRLEKLEELAESQEHSPRLDGGIEQAHILEQYTNVLLSLAEHQPLLLVLDDLQWADVASTGLLFRLGRSIGDSRILLVGTFRPAEVAIGRNGKRHPLEKVLAEFKRYFGDIEINLGEAEDRERRHLVNALVDAEPHRLSAEFREALFDRTGGHPLFTIELVRALQERGDLVRDIDGSWVEGGSLHWDALPSKVEGVIEERIGRLDESARETLAVASVEGEQFTAEVVATVREVQARTLVRQLGRDLEHQHGLVRSQGLRRLSGGATRLSLYAFHHNLFQRYLYTGLSEADRMYLHEDVGNAIETLCDECPDEFVVQLARHFSEAGIADKAAEYLRRAGELSMARYANDEAGAYLTRALELTPGANNEARWDLLLSLERVHGIQGARAEQATDLIALGQLSADLDEDRKRSEVAIRTAAFANGRGDFRGAIAAAESAVRRAAPGRDIAREARANVEWGTALVWLGQLDDAKDRLERALALSEGVALHRIQASCLKGLARIRLERGELHSAEADYRQALAISRRLNDPFGEAQFVGNLGIVNQKLGNLEAARECYEDVRLRHRKMGDRRGEGISLHNLGEVAVELHDYATARSAYEEALEISIGIGDQPFAATTMCSLGGAEVKLGLYGEALTRLGRSQRLAERIEQKSDVGFVLAWSALLHLALGDHRRAGDCARQALRLAREVAEPLLEGRALDFLGRISEATGVIDGAASAYGQSVAVRREYGLFDAAIESVAGQARTALAHGDGRRALALVEETLAHHKVRGFRSTETPTNIYLTCYGVLAAAGDPRAAEVLADGDAYLSSMADRIDDPQVRQSFLENVAANRTITALAATGRGGP